jgi:hypothetical protein
MVVRHVRCVQDQEGWEGTAVIEGDASDPEAVLAAIGDLALRPARAAEEVPPKLIDLAEPVCAVFGGTLSAMDAETARKAAAGFAGKLAPGSAMIISCASFADAGLGARMAEACGAAGSWHNHPADDVASFFDAGGLRLVHGRVMDVKCWPACPAAGAIRDAAVLGGIGIKALRSQCDDHAQDAALRSTRTRAAAISASYSARTASPERPSRWVVPAPGQQRPPDPGGRPDLPGHPDGFFLGPRGVLACRSGTSSAAGISGGLRT